MIKKDNKKQHSEIRLFFTKKRKWTNTLFFFKKSKKRVFVSEFSFLFEKISRHEIIRHALG
ncbi:hypothetical protein RCZ15_25030 [Capnocytophaga catalasegens]|uniref:Uncharacterized protein n=1 Tax=Capnocytophaga catalasegens TaxID=1004260 RepID=A0AAV5AZQ1_9FLAO|nr:hypothetical protein RCZ03_04110 [Capnocytophaga catalasegens]GJM51530.1 hypothetical protein RCZ15_25030 [Capnocytophaga catalasegens]GJM53434.1 hypothetical protein RCZ16_17510 [Capnocytophaga catalasegens]